MTSQELSDIASHILKSFVSYHSLKQRIFSAFFYLFQTSDRLHSNLINIYVSSLSFILFLWVLWRKLSSMISKWRILNLKSSKSNIFLTKLMKLVIEAPLGIGFGYLEIFISRHNQNWLFWGQTDKVKWFYA